MGWLLTLLLAVPQVDGAIQVEMWFSRESYCTFAQAKFMEQPMYSIGEGAPRRPVKVTDSSCRELGPKDGDRIPPHMRAQAVPPTGETAF